MPRVSPSSAKYRARHVAPRARRGSQVAMTAAGVVPTVALPVVAVVQHHSHDDGAPAQNLMAVSVTPTTGADAQPRRGQEAAEARRVAARRADLAEQRAKQRAAQAKAAAQAQAAAQRRRLEALDPRLVAARMVTERGWGREQFQCLAKLWHKESSWRVDADNPTSSAYGIPQALPGSKMASAGADWRTNPATQIRWGLGYIAGRYGTPCSAWAHSRSVNWY